MPDPKILLDALETILRTRGNVVARKAVDTWNDELAREQREAEQAEAERKARLRRTIVIKQDEDPQNPRIDFDNVATMACWHPRYNLGDKDGEEQLREAVRASKGYKPVWEEEYINIEYSDENDNPDYLDLSDPAQLIAAAERCSDLITLPLYLYDHSGITMSTGSFGDKWDSGQVGIIFVTEERATEEWGYNFVRMNEDVRDDQGNLLYEKGRYYSIHGHFETDYFLRDHYGLSRYVTADKVTGVADHDVWTERMKAEVEFYDLYIRNLVYGFIIYEHDVDEPPEDGEEIDSCWGFYGWPDEYEKNGMSEHWPEDWREYEIKEPF